MAIKESPYGSIEAAQLSRWSWGSVGPFIFAIFCLSTLIIIEVPVLSW